MSVEALPVLRPQRATLDPTAIVLVSFAALLVVLVLLPLAWIAVYAVSEPKGGLTLANFRRLVSDPQFRDPLVTTMTIAFSVGLSCALIAASLAWLVARTDMPLRLTIRTLVMASFVTPPFLGAVAWEFLASPNSGLLNQLYRWLRALLPGWLAGLLPADHLFNIHTLSGLIFVITCYTFPYVFVLVANALDRIPGELEDASAMLGARRAATALRITIPLAMPTLVAGVLIAFLQAMNLFGSPAILALPAGFHTLTTKIWSLFSFPPKPELAAAAALPLLLVTIGLLVLQRLALGRRGYSVIGGKYGAPRPIPLRRAKWPALAFSLTVLACPVFLPYAALFNAALSKSASRLISPETLTLQNLHFTFFELSATPLAIWNTTILAIGSATVLTLLVLVIAYLTSRSTEPGHKALSFFATAPIAIPGIVLGVGLFLSYTRPPLALYGTLWILLIAYVTIEMPAAYQQMQSAFHALNPELEDAARIFGTTRLGTLVRITAPLLMSSVIATWCFIFIAVVRELSAAVILFTSETKVLSVLIFDLKESGDLGAIAVLGIAMMGLTTLVITIVNRIPGVEGGQRLRNA